jgi:ELWxxDGT repeat protein
MAAPTAGWGVVPQLLRNINTAIVPASSTPGFLGILNGKMLFAATDGTGTGLWSTDGNSSGTVLLRRLAVFPQIMYPGSPEFVVIGSRGYFVVLGPTQGAQIWSTDGTAAGTTLVADLGTAPGGGRIPVLFGAFGSRLVFSADDVNGHQQMFATNGANPGVQVLTHLASTEFGVTGALLTAGNKLYFVTYGPDGLAGNYTGTIWVSDGTTAGTHQVTNPYGSNNTVGYDAVHYPQSLTLVGTQVLYTSSGLLWGIDTSTDTIAAVSTAGGMAGFGPPSVSAGLLIDMGGYVAFLGGGAGAFASAQLWRSDGTAAGTFSVAPATSQQYPLFQRVGNHVLFYGTDAQNNVQVMSSDVTAGNVVQLTTGTQPSNVSFTRAIYHATIAGFAYFSLSDGPQTTTWSVWRTDGTVAGTRRLGGIPPIDQSEPGLTRVAGDSTAIYIETYAGNPDVRASLYEYDAGSDTARALTTAFYSSLTDGFLAGGGALYFATNDPVKGDEPWISNGTAAGTHLIANLNPEISDSGSSPESFVALNGKLVFAADDGVHGRELWTSDGTNAGTVLFSDVNPGAASSDPSHLFVSNSALYFFATDANGKQNFMRLAANTVPPQTLTSNLTPPPPAQFGIVTCQQDTPAVLNGLVYFAANDGTSGTELWSTDGTAAGTHMVADIASGGLSSDPCNLTVFNSHLYFSATGPAGNELWTSDGTSAGTLQVVDIAQGTAGSSPTGLTVFNGALYFGGYDSTKAQLWKTDGSASGTTALGEIIPNAGAYVVPVGAVNNKLLIEVFTFDSQTAGYTSHLWTTDGTPAGGADLGVSPSGAVFISQSGRAFFQAPGAAGSEPWVSDATAAGTHLLTDVNPTAQSAIRSFVDFHGLTLFTVTGSSSGAQLWRSDGTAAGTVVISSIQPPPTPTWAIASNHLQLAVGNQFVLAGNDPVTGSELYGFTLGLPLSAADSANSSGGQQVTIDVLSNDSDSDGTLSPASVSISTPASHGTVAAGANGDLVYTPTAGFSGTDTFAYTVSDDQGATSNPATVTVTVTAAAPTPPPSTGSGGGGGGAIGILELFGLLAFGGTRAYRRFYWGLSP